MHHACIFFPYFVFFVDDDDVFDVPTPLPWVNFIIGELWILESLFS